MKVVSVAHVVLGATLFALLFNPVFAQDVDFGYVRGIGGASEENASGIARDSLGNSFVGGYFQGTPDFDPGAGTTSIASAGQYDGFIGKYDPDGNLIWVHTFGDVDFDYIFGVAVDSADNVYVTGTFLGTVDFDPGPGTQNVTAASFFSEAFVLKLDSDGNFLWVKIITGAGSEIGFAITLDPSGNIYSMGQFTGTADFDPGPGSDNIASLSGNDLYIQKLDSAGNYLWAATVDGEVRDFGRYLSLDSTGAVYLSAGFQGTVDFDPGVGVDNRTSAGDSDIFIWKLDASGNLAWVHTLGSANDDDGASVAIDSADNVIVAGSFQGTVDFDPGAGTSNLASISTYSLFVLKLTSGGVYTWAGAFTGMDDGFTYGLTVDNFDEILVVGSFEGTADFDPGAGGAIATSAGDEDFYITKLDSAGAWKWTEQRGTVGRDVGATIIHDGAGSFLITGLFSNTLDFDTSASTTSLTAVGSFDTFFMKLVPKMGGVITSSPTPGNIYDNDPLTLIAPAGFSSYVWKRNGVVLGDSGARITGTNSQMVDYAPVLLADQGTFTVTYDDGTGSIVESAPYNLVVLLSAALPASRLGGLALLTLFLGLAGLWILRQRRTA